MNLIIIILGLIDTILIYVISIISSSLKIEILADVLISVIFVLFWNWEVEKHETMGNLKWITLVILIFALCGLIILLIRKQYENIHTEFSIVIPMYISYLAMRIKIKKEGYDEFED